MLVPNIHWIVIEDSETKTDLVRNLILNSKLIVTHLNAKTPPFEQLKDKVIVSAELKIMLLSQGNGESNTVA